MPVANLQLHPKNEGALNCGEEEGGVKSSCVIDGIAIEMG